MKFCFRKDTGRIYVFKCKKVFVNLFECYFTDFLWASSSRAILGGLHNFRSSRPEVFCKKDVLKNFAKFTGKHLC